LIVKTYPKLLNDSVTNTLVLLPPTVLDVSFEEVMLETPSDLPRTIWFLDPPRKVFPH
jgi:hypothetical protein